MTLAAGGNRIREHNHSLFHQPGGKSDRRELSWLDTLPVRESDLPPPDTVHWCASRKAIIVAAVKSGILTLPKACLRYRLTPEELEAWQRQFERFGPAGLRATQVQRYREPGYRSHEH